MSETTQQLLIAALREALKWNVPGLREDVEKPSRMDGKDYADEYVAAVHLIASALATVGEKS